MTTEEKLKEMLGDWYEMGVPGSPNAAILQNILGADNELRDPQSENEALLKLIYEDVIGAVYDARDEAQAAAAQAGTAAEAVANKAPAITDTASGSIASFTDGADSVEIKSAVVQIEPVQSGSGDPSPDNVRPISGWTGAKVTRTGKNLLDDSIKNYNQKNIIFGGPTSRFSGISCSLKAGTYTLSVVTADGTVTNIYVKDSDTYANISGFPAYGLLSKTFTLSKDTNLLVFCYKEEYTSASDITHAQIELSSTVTPYEPYHATTYPLTLPSTVYGGQAVYNGGGLWTVTSDMAVANVGDLSWTYNASGAYFNVRKTDKAFGAFNVISDTYATSTSTSVSGMGDNQIKGGANDNYVYIKDSAYTDVTSFKAARGTAQIVYELATPITYTVTTEQLLTLYGQNNFFADCGDISVEYRADTKLYINKILGSSETDMVADTNIESGKYFFVGGQLYLSTAAIAAGATIIPGTNCTATNVAEALNIINA